LTTALAAYDIFWLFFCEEETPRFPLENQIDYRIFLLFLLWELVKAVNSEYLQKEFILVVRRHFGFLFITNFCRNSYNL